MNKLPVTTRVNILNALTEGCSLRSTSRMTGVSINTVTKLLVDAGKACDQYQYDNLRNLSCKVLELDEIWSFVYAKEKNVPEGMKGEGVGSVWTWVAIDAETKLIPSWLVGLRDGEYACWFVADLAARLFNRVQITTDGLKAYVKAIEDGFDGNVDYAVLHKVYGPGVVDGSRYSPPACIGCETHAISGNPDEAKVSTSYIERQNLTMRMRMVRFTRLTNGFSTTPPAIALHFMHYNFIKKHTTIKTTPAMAGGVVDHQWTMEELVDLIDRHAADPLGIKRLSHN
jgi:IS1 family transposase